MFFFFLLFLFQAYWNSDVQLESKCFKSWRIIKTWIIGSFHLAFANINLIKVLTYWVLTTNQQWFIPKQVIFSTIFHLAIPSIFLDASVTISTCKNENVICNGPFTPNYRFLDFITSIFVWFRLELHFKFSLKKKYLLNTKYTSSQEILIRIDSLDNKLMKDNTTPLNIYSNLFHENELMKRIKKCKN